MFCRTFGIALALAFLAACSRQPVRPAVERMAILRFENLGADPSLDWMGRAFSEIITGELAGTDRIYAIPSARLHGLDGTLGPRPVTSPGVSAERAQALAAGANRLGYGEYWLRGGRLETRLVIEDPATRKTLDSFAVSGAPGAVVAMASALAQHVSGRIAPYGTRDPAAVKAYVGAIESASPNTAETLQDAISADPNFGPLYRELAEIKLRQHDGAGALAVLGQAVARAGSLGAIENARVRFDYASLRGDQIEREQALIALTRADPADPLAWRDLGLAFMNRHQYPRAQAALRNALEIQPDDVDSLNQLGYAAAYAGNLEDGLRALQQYRQLQPANPNPVDSMGDVNLLAGRTRDAVTDYLEAARKDPSFYAGLDFLKAAMARLMSGDVAGANDIAKQYSAARAAAHDPLAEFRDAEWQWISGKRLDAYRQMEKLAANSQRELAAPPTAELALMSILLGHREAAANLAEKALATATPATAPVAALARFLAQPPASPAEWAARAGRLAPNPAQAAFRDTALAYALLLDKKYQAAAPVLERLYGQEQPGAEALPILLAWARLETGRTADAAALLRFNPVLPNTGLNVLASFYFPRIYYLRGLAAERMGKAAEAHDDYALFRKLSGPDELVWDQAEKAR